MFKFVEALQLTGAVNVLLCLTMVFIAVVKPQIGQAKP